jgi:hypothetical protein
MAVNPVPYPRLKRSDYLLRRVQLQNSRYMHAKMAAVLNLAVDGSAKKRDHGSVFDFFTLFLGESSIHGLNHLVAQRRDFTE